MKSLVTQFLEASKERFILKNKSLSDAEKSEMIDFYKKHSNLDSEGIDWQKNWTYDDFKKVKDKYVAPINTSGLEEGVDYLYYGEKNGLKYYVPLTHDAARALGGEKADERWCIVNLPAKWEEYAERETFFVFIFDETNDPICLEFDMDNLWFWNRQNKTYGFDYNALYDDEQFDFTCPTDENAAFKNEDVRLALSDNKKYASKIDKSILRKIDHDTNDIIALIQEY